MWRKWGSMLGFGWKKLLLVRPQRAFSDVLGVWPFYQMQIGGGVSLFWEVKKNPLKDTSSLCIKRVRATHHDFSSLLALSWHGEIGPAQFQFCYLVYKHVRAWPAIKMENSSYGLINTSREVPVFPGAVSTYTGWEAEWGGPLHKYELMRKKMHKRFNLNSSQ